MASSVTSSALSSTMMSSKSSVRLRTTHGVPLPESLFLCFNDLCKTFLSLFAFTPLQCTVLSALVEAPVLLDVPAPLGIVGGGGGLGRGGTPALSSFCKLAIPWKYKWKEMWLLWSSMSAYYSCGG